MTVFVLGSSADYQGMDIEAVYSSKEKAVEALNYSEYLNENDIYEFDLDPPNEGKIYETYFYVNIDPNAKEQVWGGTLKQKPSEFIEFKFVFPTLTQTRGFGKTHEEAEANARKGQIELHPVWQVSVNGSRYQHAHPSLVFTHWEPYYAVHEDYNVAKIAIMEYAATGNLSPFLVVAQKPSL